MSGNNLSKLFGTDMVAEVEGVWIDYAEGVSMKIARMGGANYEYSRYLSAQLKPYKFQLDKGTLSEEKSKEIMADVIARCVLKDWKGVTDGQGQPIEFSLAAAKEILFQYPELLKDLQTQASDYRRFALEVLEDVVKN